MKELNQIIKDREITRVDDVDFLNQKYWQYEIQKPIFTDQVESLLEEGYLLMIDNDGKVIVSKKISIDTPEVIQESKRFFRELDKVIGDNS